MKAKKILSLLLVIALITSLVPAFSFAAGEVSEGKPDVKLLYDLSADLYRLGLRYNTTTPIQTLDYESTNYIYSFFKAKSGVSDTAVDNNNIKYAYFNVTNDSADKRKDVIALKNLNYVSFKINVPVKTEYDVKVHRIWTTGSSYTGDVNVYISQGSESTDTSDFIGTYNCKTTAETGLNNTAEYITIGKKELEAGEHIITFHNATSEYSYGIVSSFSLASGNGEKTVLAAMKTTSPVSLNAGQGTDFDTSLYMSDGSAAASEYSIEYKSSNEAATVNDEGRITAVSEGTADVTATAVNEYGTEITATKKVTVSGKPQPTEKAGIKVVYDLSCRWGKWSDDTVKFREFTYLSNKGFWEYYGNKNNFETIDKNVYNWRGAGGTLQLTSVWWAVKITVPKSGVYTPGVASAKYRYGGIIGVYLVNAKDGELTEESLTGQTRLGQKTCYEKDVNPQIDDITEFAPLYIENGEYYLVYKFDGKDEYKGTAYVYVGNLTLDGTEQGTEEQNVLMRPVVSSRYSIRVGETETLAASVYNNRGELSENVTFTYEAKNEDTATVDETTGVVTAIKAGNAAFTVTATDGVSTVSSDCAIKINPENASGYVVTYEIPSGGAAEGTYENTNDFWQYNTSGKDWTAVDIKVPVSGEYLIRAENDVYIIGTEEEIESTVEKMTPGGVIYLDAGEYTAVIKGDAGKVILDGGEQLALMKANVTVEKSRAVLSGILSDGSAADMTNAQVTYASSDKSVATVNEAGIISENSVGETTITADVIFGQVSKRLSVVHNVVSAPMSYAGVDVIYDFRAKNGWDTNKTKEAGFSDATSMYDARGITYDYTGVGGEDGNWEYRGVGSINGWNSFAHVGGEFEIYKEYLKGRLKSANQYMAFNIKVPAPGKYSPTLEYMKRATAEATLDLHVLPGDTPNDGIFEALTEDTYFGTVNFDDKSLSTFVQYDIKLNNLEFEKAGEYILVFKQPASIKGTYFGLVRLIMEGKNCIDSALVTVSDDELNYKETAAFSVSATRLDGTEMERNEFTVEYDSSYPEIVSVDKNGIVTALGDGKSDITVKVTDGVKSVTKTVTVKATDNTEVIGTSADIHPNIYVRGAEKLDWRADMQSGNRIKIDPATISCRYSTEGIVEMDENGKFFGLAPGTVTVTLSADFRGTQVSEEITLNVLAHGGKTGRNYYTDEKVANARENISKYSWAKSERNTAVNIANKYANSIDVIYDNIFGEGIPRANYIGYYDDPEYKCCHYCGTDVVAKYGATSEGWNIDIVSRPWKLQCPECKRLFPSNDFELLYKRGIDEQGYYNRERAIQKNAEAVANGEADALKNVLYPEIESQRTPENGGAQGAEVTLNLGKGLRPGETVEGWGVDDGWGYVPKNENGESFVFANGVMECHAYIPAYAYYAYQGYATALQNLALAYVYTDDIKYGRAGAIIMDRLADVYPSFDCNQYKKKYPLACGGTGIGHVLGAIADPAHAVKIATAADALFPATDDAEVIAYLEKKAEKFGLENKKQSGLDIWNNWDENIFDHIFTLVKDGRVRGNYGLYHHALSSAAIAKSAEPETGEMLAWLYEKDDEATSGVYEGGDFTSKFVDVVDRNGMGNEAAPAYNGMWLGRLYGMADMLSHYKGEKSYNPYEHPKFVNMFLAFIPIITINAETANVGDNNGTLGGINFNETAFVDTFKNITDPSARKKIAEGFYIYKNYDVSGLNYGIFEKDPERLSAEIETLAGGKPPVLRSEMMTGYGFAIVRAGAKYLSTSSVTENNNMRDMWMWFGRNAGHGHNDILELGIDAYGLNLAPDLGYPEITGTDAKRLQWVEATISHNTVSVDRNSHVDHGIHGYPKHFDDSGKIKVIDISAPKAYNQVSEYRRTAVMVEVNDDISYIVDFFRVKGGKVHTYSFHSQAENAYAADGLEITEQKDEQGNWKGSYADENWPVGEDPNSPEAWNYETVYPRGYSWMGKVRRDTSPEKKFSVEFDVEDYKKRTAAGNDVTLRVTQLLDFQPSEVALVTGPVPNRSTNKQLPATLDYMLVHREGENLDTLFTTVFEPYQKGARYLSDMNAVEVTVSQSSEIQPKTDDAVRAVRIEHENGRIDYVICATNTSVTYNIGGEFEFRGAIGVYSKNAEGEVITRYVNDGDIIGSESGTAARLTGTVEDFTRTLEFENYIDVNLPDVKPEDIAGKYIYVDNDDVENGVYPIESAERLDEDTLRLSTGYVTLIRAHRDSADPEKGYIYNIKPGQSFTIPMAFVDENLPEFEAVAEALTTSAGSTITVALNARSPLEGQVIKYAGTSLPRGMSLDEDTGLLTWKPDASQIGENHIAVTAVDSDGREATVHFEITVYGATTGSSASNEKEDSGEETAGTPTGGGGGGGASAPDTGNSSGNTDAGEGDSVLPDEEEKAGDSENAPDASGETDVIRFTDLDSYKWAADAVTALAEEGIIKGTAPDTYSPARNITRADFASLLVRGFGLTSNSSENFADVSPSDYFAAELAIARNAGIVGGIGENKFAPRSSITRQDMMVIIYRTLHSLDVGFGENVEPQYSDFDTVAPYARDAVSALIGAGLVNGKNGVIAPADYTTRAEVAVLLKRVLDYKNESERLK